MPSLPEWALSHAHLGIAVMVWTPNFSQILTCIEIIESTQNPFHSPNVQKMKGPQLTLVYAKLQLCRSSVMMTFLHIPYYTTHTYKHRLLFFYSVLSDLAFVDEKNSSSSLDDRSNLNERPVVFFIVLLSLHIQLGICIRPSSGMNSSRVSMICCSFGVTPLDLKSSALSWVIINFHFVASWTWLLLGPEILLPMGCVKLGN